MNTKQEIESLRYRLDRCIELIGKMQGSLQIAAENSRLQLETSKKNYAELLGAVVLLAKRLQVKPQEISNLVHEASLTAKQAILEQLYETDGLDVDDPLN